MMALIKAVIVSLAISAVWVCPVCGCEFETWERGYDCKLYQKYLKGWRKLQMSTRAQNNHRRVETLWLNFEPVEQMKLLN